MLWLKSLILALHWHSCNLNNPSTWWLLSQMIYNVLGLMLNVSPCKHLAMKSERGLGHVVTVSFFSHNGSRDRSKNEGSVLDTVFLLWRACSYLLWRAISWNGRGHALHVRWSVSNFQGLLSVQNKSFSTAPLQADTSASPLGWDGKYLPCCMKSEWGFQPRRDSNPQSSDPKSDALSIRPRGHLLLVVLFFLRRACCCPRLNHEQPWTWGSLWKPT